MADPLLDAIDPEDAHDPGARRIALPAGWEPTAEFSSCGLYRYKLIHRWAPGPLLLWGMMNPSRAGMRSGDATVNKTGQMARLLGFGGQMIANACAARFTDKDKLLTVEDPVGPRNRDALLEMAAEAGMIVIAHGRLPGGLQVHADGMVRLLREAGHTLHVLRLLDDGTPTHPLARGKGHVPVTTKPVVWEA